MIGDRGDKRQKRFIIHTMLFGEDSVKDLPEEVVEILIDSGVARSEWDALSRQIEVRGQLGNRLSAANKFKRLAQGLGMAGTTAATLWHVWYNKASENATKREIARDRGVLGKIRQRVDVAEPDPRPKAKQRVKDRGESF